METNAIVETPKTSNKEKVKIFIIDDDPIYNTVLEHKLQKHPEYIINTFKTGESCFRYMEELDPDIVILDYRLNDSNPKAKNGLEILKRLKGIKPGIAVLMLSSQDSFEVVSNSIRNGAFDYIAKNEGTFVKLQHLIDKILKEKQLKNISRIQNNYLKLLIVLGVLIIIIPMVLIFLNPKNISWIILGLLIGYTTLFAFINKTQFSKQHV